MSLTYFAWAMNESQTRLAARLALFVLSDMAQDHTFPQSETDDDAPTWYGICWPTAKTIARKAHIGRSQTFEALAKLEQLGLIRTVPAIEHNLTIHGKPVKTPIRQLAGPDGFKQLPCEDEPPAPVQNPDGSGNPDAGGSGNPDTNRNKEQEEGEADASPSKKSGEIEEAKPTRYTNPETPGSAAAPWLVIELARLMRANDSKVKLPVGLRELMAPEYLQAYGNGGSFASLDKRRELIAPVVDKPALVKWLDAARLLIDADERPAREVAEVLRWTQQDSFEMSNILSFPKLRQRYDQLRAKALSAPSGRTGGGAGQTPHPSASTQMDALARRAAEQRRQVEGEG